MERRLLTFIIASSVFFFAYITLRSWLGVPPVKPDPAIAEVPAEDPQASIVDGANSIAKDSGVADQQTGDDATATAPEIKRPENTEWLTVGSMDAADGYYMLVTLCSKGAGVERVELTERGSKGELKYRRVDVTSGYLGYFAGTELEATDGVLVNVVGPGTPAANAGIEVGDIIVGVNGVAVASRDDLVSILSMYTFTAGSSQIGKAILCMDF